MDFTLVFNGFFELLIKIAKVSTNTPGKPFSPKSIILSIALTDKNSLVFENSGVFNKNLGNTNAT